MLIDRVLSGLDIVRERWHKLDGDWKSVVLATVFVVLIFVFELRIPW